MKIVFSRKGFDSTAGGAPSPIHEGRPVSLPIPEAGSGTRYADLGLGELVAGATRGRMGGEDHCHDDPMFAHGRCWFGQCEAAQGHLRRQGVGEGDVFLFFGLFADAATGERHHRLFGAMRVACHGDPETLRSHPEWRDPPRPHPHIVQPDRRQNCIWHGPAALAAHAGERLRLTAPGGPLNLWRVPEWLSQHGLSYHARASRWIAPTLLDSARRGQEFVCDIGDAPAPRRWLAATLAEIGLA